jgi:hypothetical protein
VKYGPGGRPNPRLVVEENVAARYTRAVRPPARNSPRKSPENPQEKAT